MPDLEVTFERLRRVEFSFIDESGRLRLSGLGVVSERKEGIESAIAGVPKSKGSRHLNKDCIFAKGEVENPLENLRPRP